MLRFDQPIIELEDEHIVADGLFVFSRVNLQEIGHQQDQILQEAVNAPRLDVEGVDQELDDQSPLIQAQFGGFKHCGRFLDQNGLQIPVAVLLKAHREGDGVFVAEQLLDIHHGARVIDEDEPDLALCRLMQRLNLCDLDQRRQQITLDLREPLEVVQHDIKRLFPRKVFIL